MSGNYGRAGIGAQERRRQHRCRTGASGFTLIEIAVTASILALVALGVATSTTTSLSLKAVNRETRAAMLLARQAAEQLRTIQPVDLVAMVAPDSPDAVPLAGTLLDDVCRVACPDLASPRVRVVLPRDPTTGRIAETVSAPGLGMPRDLNLDGVLDSDDRSADCSLLPILIRVEWRAEHGTRTLELLEVLLSDNLRGTRDAAL